MRARLIGGPKHGEIWDWGQRRERIVVMEESIPGWADLSSFLPVERRGFYERTRRYGGRQDDWVFYWTGWDGQQQMPQTLGLRIAGEAIDWGAWRGPRGQLTRHAAKLGLVLDWGSYRVAFDESLYSWRFRIMAHAALTS